MPTTETSLHPEPRETVLRAEQGAAEALAVFMGLTRFAQSGRPSAGGRRTARCLRGTNVSGGSVHRRISASRCEPSPLSLHREQLVLSVLGLELRSRPTRRSSGRLTAPLN